MDILGGEIRKKAFNPIPFTPKMRTLAYVMIFNLYLVKNLTTLLAPRAIFLFDLFTHKEIDICSHIYFLFTKCITKRNSRLILPFPSLVWLLSQGQGWRFLVVFPCYKGIIQSVLEPWLEAKPIFPGHLLVSLKSQETMLLKKVKTQKKK